MKHKDTPESFWERMNLIHGPMLGSRRFQTREDRLKPNPGSQEAVSQGCSCPQEENRGGEGVAHSHTEKPSGKFFCVDRECPLHGFDIE